MSNLAGRTALSAVSAMSLCVPLQHTYRLKESNIDSAKFDAHGVSATLTKKF